jgi:class 3 adenylate cyclase
MVELPSGTVTFLFTDLEVSTRLWEQEPEAMRQALARHDEILRDAVARHGGHVVKGTGDGVHAVFVIPDDAVGAAVDAQLGLAEEPWVVTEPLRVRMGLHTGVAELREGDYFGGPVNRAARLMSVAHGGQVVLSEVTTGLVRDRVPAGVSLVDLGEHRLRDLSRAERVYQLHRPGLEESFPPLRSLEVLPNNLPVQLTSFIGRESEIAAVAKLLEGNRLMTLTGAAGCGKTRLALQVGAEVLGRFVDGVWLVELAALTDPAFVAGAIASSLGLRQADAGLGMSLESAGGLVTPLEELVIEYLGPKEMVLVLDNCEHLVGACASFADRSLHHCPGLRILATSREPLGVDGESNPQGALAERP